ncbi:hypothetical protein GCM10010922_18500 [Microbacterium sorbitolivorans]|uniref:hypothetical protein n=1 Tax=Microbacterium sorbitolivorans TaxID=1867410 RepID=UPI001995C444|nr:hypothetical protein [Microbacterium sorbitolivorans]GGF43338.1 hypothetical protein GCM10010922_18500 [Microbacterium sorbitolivorans]
MKNGSIDRRALVARHDVRQTSLDPRGAVSVGNGEFAFTFDITGLQTFPDEFPVEPRPNEPDRDAPGTFLGTQAQWAWHSIPGEREYDLAESTRWHEVDGREVPYLEEVADTAEQAAATRWFRANPHRLDLGRIGFCGADGAALQAAELTATEQVLSLWEGIARSTFARAGHGVTVTTAAHPHRDAIGVSVSGGAAAGLAIRIAFPYGSGDWHNAADWENPTRHTTTVTERDGGWLVERELDGSRYEARIVARGAALERAGEHEIRLRLTGDDAEFSIEFSTDGSGDMVGLPGREPGRNVLRAAEIRGASADHWASFWSAGSAIALASDDDPRAAELERRIVLSQYVTAVNCAGSLPPQETGLVCNSWRGKFHLEMHWWHAAHFPMWGRPELLRRSLGWYAEALDLARATARAQGYAGARWPKQLGSAMRETPSTIGVFLLWQQPHPIALAELVYRATGDRAVLEEFAEMVFETADFMADVVTEDDDGRFVLGPPLIPAQESYAADRLRMSNPTFELAYWRWALRVASEWRERLGHEARERWIRVAEGIADPHMRGGVYTSVDVPPFTIREDHPSMLGALGFVPDVGLIDPAVMRATYLDVLREWDWESTWGWDYPLMAMTASRLGEPGWAIDALMRDAAKNEVAASGHNHQNDSLPLYLPGNGGLLAAIAVMAAQHRETGDGFPPGWSIAQEGFTTTM